jgi:hypothetical protein
VPASDISGNPIEPDAPATIVARFEDGTRRQLTVTSAEAATYRERGTNVTKWRHRAVAFLGWNPRKLVLWAAALYVASLVIPAATKQWSDRQEALALKAALVVDLTEASSKTYATALSIPVLAREQGQKPALALRRRLRTAWLSTDAVTDTRLATYFGGGLQDQWLAYQDAMWAWIALGLCCGRNTDDNLQTVRSYLHDHPPSVRWRRTAAKYGGSPWGVLKCAPHDKDEACLTIEGDPAFDSGYIWTGQALNDRRTTLVKRIRGSDVRGFSTDWKDFAGDVWPLNDDSP